MHIAHISCPYVKHNLPLPIIQYIIQCNRNSKNSATKSQNERLFVICSFINIRIVDKMVHILHYLIFLNIEKCGFFGITGL